MRDTNDTERSEPEELSPEGIRMFTKMLRAIEIEEEPDSVPDTRLLIRYLAGFLDAPQKQQIERMLIASPNRRGELLRIQKMLRLLRVQPWSAILQRAREGDETAILWVDIAGSQAVQTEDGRKLWLNLPLEDAWNEIRQRAIRGVQHATIAWSAFQAFAEEWKAVRRLDGMRLASTKGKSAPPIVFNALRGSQQDQIDQQSIEDMFWNAQIDQHGDLVAEVRWTATHSGAASSPTHALLSVRFADALWPLGVAECMQTASHPVKTVAVKTVAVKTMISTINWTIAGFGEAMTLGVGSLAPEYFRIDLLNGSHDEIPVTRQPLYTLIGDAGISGSLFGVASPQTPGIIDPLVAEAFDGDGSLMQVPPLVLSLGAPPIWQPPQLIIEVEVPKYAGETYRDLTLILETAIGESCWQRLGMWPVRNWLPGVRHLTLDMQAPGAEDKSFTTSLRARLVEIE